MRQERNIKQNTPQENNSRRAVRLRKRLGEINTNGEKELAAIFDSIEKAKAVFRIKKT